MSGRGKKHIYYFGRYEPNIRNVNDYFIKVADPAYRAVADHY
jgi:hypothetical protein